MKHKAGNLGVDLLLIDTGKDLISNLLSLFWVLIDEATYDGDSYIVNFLLDLVGFPRNLGRQKHLL